MIGDPGSGSLKEVWSSTMSGSGPSRVTLVNNLLFTITATVIGGLILFLLQPIFSSDHPDTSSDSDEPTRVESSAPPTSTSRETARSSVVATSPSPPSTSVAPKSASAALPYRADWSTGLDGWVGTEDWIVDDGKLLNRGESYNNDVSITAPILLDAAQDYAVDAQIQLIRNSNAGRTSGSASFGIVVRADSDGGGYGAGRCVSAGIFSCNGPDDSVAVLWTAEDGTVLDAAAFSPGDNVHRYRVEVRGNELTVLIDGATILTATDNTYLTGRRVGLWSNQAQVSVLSFEVTPL